MLGQGIETLSSKTWGTQEGFKIGSARSKCTFFNTRFFFFFFGLCLHFSKNEALWSWQIISASQRQCDM